MSLMVNLLAVFFFIIVDILLYLWCSLVWDIRKGANGHYERPKDKMISGATNRPRSFADSPAPIKFQPVDNYDYIKFERADDGP